MGKYSVLDLEQNISSYCPPSHTYLLHTLLAQCIFSHTHVKYQSIFHTLFFTLQPCMHIE